MGKQLNLQILATLLIQNNPHNGEATFEDVKTSQRLIGITPVIGKQPYLIIAFLYTSIHIVCHTQFYTHL